LSHGDHTPICRLRIILRDHRVLDADARIPEGQFVASYLAIRKRYVNLTDIDWIGVGEHVPHLALKVDTILWCGSLDGGLPLISPLATADAREIEIELEGGYLLHAGLLLTPGQRLSDYLQSAPPFVPLKSARLVPRGRDLGDIAVNHEAIHFVREVDRSAVEPEVEEAPDAAADVG
jgi:hypothetical protein